MKLGLINSAWAGRDTAWGLNKTREIGFDTVDITADADPLVISVQEKKLIKDTADDLGLPIVSVCCVAVGLLDFNVAVKQFHVDRVKRYLDMCYEFEARNLLLVLGEYIWDKQVIPPSEQWKLAVESTRAVGEYAQSLGLEIVMELEPFKMSLLNSVDAMVKFLNDVDLPNTVKANCDISHLHLCNAPVGDVAKLKGMIGHVHLSDCDGKVHGDLPPGRGCTPIRDYLHAIQQTGFDGVVSLELEFSPEPDKIVEWVTEAYAETDKIMRALEARH